MGDIRTRAASCTQCGKSNSYLLLSVLHSIRMREGYVQEPLSGLGHRGIALSQDMGANVQERKEPCWIRSLLGKTFCTT